MIKSAATLGFVLSLFGCDPGASSFVHHVRADGSDLLHGRATVQAGVARFECLRSASGGCHFLVLAEDCAADGSCASTPARRFVLPSGDSRQITGLHRFRLCMASTAHGPEQACEVLGPDPRG